MTLWTFLTLSLREVHFGPWLIDFFVLHDVLNLTDLAENDLIRLKALKTTKMIQKWYRKDLNQPCLQEKRSCSAKIGFHLHVHYLSECCRPKYCNSVCHHFRLHFPILSTFHRFHQYHCSSSWLDNLRSQIWCKNGVWLRYEWTVHSVKGYTLIRVTYPF